MNAVRIDGNPNVTRKGQTDSTAMGLTAPPAKILQRISRQVPHANRPPTKNESNQ